MLLSEMYASAKEDLGSLNGELPCAKVDVLARRSEGAGLSEQRFHPFRERMLFVLKSAAGIHHPEATLKSKSESGNCLLNRKLSPVTRDVPG